MSQSRVWDMTAHQRNPPTVVLWTSLKSRNGLAVPEQNAGVPAEVLMGKRGPSGEIQWASTSGLVQQVGSTIAQCYLLPCSKGLRV